MKPKKLKVLGVCSGSGLALLTPFLSENFKILANLEPRAVFHTQSEETWKLNFGEIPFFKTWDLDTPEVKGCPDIIVSSPDCGASSIMRLSRVKSLGNPKTSKTLNMVIAAIGYYKPSLFLIENLPKLLEVIKPADWEQLFMEYDLVFHCHSVLEFGNSQASRKRALIIGIKKGSKFKKKQFKRVFQVNKPKITRRLLKLAQMEDNYIPPMDKKLAMYDYRKLPKRDSLTVAQVYDLWNGDFKSEYKWPIKTDKMKTLPGVYRLKADLYPMTVRPSDRQFRPDGLPLGIRDFQVIMGIPLKYKCYNPGEFDPKFLYYLNKARYALTKGAVGEIGIWFKECLTQGGQM